MNKYLKKMMINTVSYAEMFFLFIINHHINHIYTILIY